MVRAPSFKSASPAPVPSEVCRVGFHIIEFPELE